MGFAVRSATFPLLSHLRHKQSSPTRLLQGSNFLRSPSIRRTQALAASSLVLGAASPPASTGDVSVLLQMSAVLLMAYWISNFVVPDIISKALHFDKPSRDPIPEDKIPSQDESGNTLESSEGEPRRTRHSFKEAKTSKF
ncbi:uncharacterized protein LOC122065484 [Macadamia integrifolia]|uniref:uncharacterized protein LOC122065484 n=1 Tax=Macadamia integrifolia TaxID=60698 RepID=UPI001C4F4CF0|nr:uncharacterized protein LOC122065484 [Macadamia integrifolia]